MFGSFLRCAARNLDVITEYFVVTHFEGLDAGFLTLNGFKIRDPLPRMFGSIHHAIQFGGIARADDTCVLQGRGRVVVNRILQ